MACQLELKTTYFKNNDDSPATTVRLVPFSSNEWSDTSRQVTGPDPSTVTGRDARIQGVFMASAGSAIRWERLEIRAQ